MDEFTYMIFTTRKGDASSVRAALGQDYDNGMLEEASSRAALMHGGVFSFVCFYRLDDATKARFRHGNPGMEGYTECLPRGFR